MKVIKLSLLDASGSRARRQWRHEQRPRAQERRTCYSKSRARLLEGWGSCWPVQLAMTQHLPQRANPPQCGADAASLTIIATILFSDSATESAVDMNGRRSPVEHNRIRFT